MVDERRVRRLLQRVTDDVAYLAERSRRNRNLLVHGYVDVDDDQVVSHLDRVEDLEAFVVSVSRWIR